ncbi:MAG: helix-turn-helix domain-containing protein [Ardenticatenales bacterium]|nr:helix-turn-helix domain-containing protein [Ardenticatenales bacterium]
MGFCVPQDRLTGVVLEKHLSVAAAAEHVGYNEQYLRRLLRAGRLEGTKVGQVWLIRLSSLEEHLRNGQAVQDRRFGPQGIVTQGEKGVTT